MKILILLFGFCCGSLVAGASTDPPTIPPAGGVHKLLAEGRADHAIATLNRTLQTNPRDAEAHNLLCRAYYYEERWDNAVSECERAVALDGKQAAYQLWLGRAYGQKADHSSFVTAASLAPKVRTAFERAVQLAPSNVDARSDLSEFYIEAPGFMGGGSDKAMAQVDAVAQRDPSAAHWLRGRIAEHRKQMDVAENEYKKAVDESSNPAPRLIDLASFYRRVQRLDAMEETVGRAAAISRSNGTELAEGGTLLLRTGRNFPGAIEMLRRYVASGEKAEIAPAFRAYVTLGTLLERTGDTGGAKDAYRRALELAADYAPAQNALRRLQ